MKTIITTLPIHSAINRQCHERAKSTRQINDRPIAVVCPRHRLPSFQWKDEVDGEAGFSSFELISKEYTGAETTLATTWITHVADTTFTHTGLDISSCVSTADFVCISDTFSVKTGDIIRIRGTMAGAGVLYPRIYMNPDPSFAYSLNDGQIDFEYRSRVSSSTASFTMFGVGVTNFSFVSVTITRIEDRKELYWFLYPDSYPLLDHDYWEYHGQTLNYPMDPGDYYLKISGTGGHIYYSDWFTVDCVYENLLTSWTNNGYETFTGSGQYLDVVNSVGASANAYTNYFSVVKDEVISVIFNLTYFGGAPTLLFSNEAGTLFFTEACDNGLNEFQFTPTWTGDTYVSISTALLNDSFLTSDVLIQRHYSEKYIIINFSNLCDLGDILYHTGFTQTIWIVTEPMENAFPQEEEGLNNGEGRFVRTFARQVKKYLMRTNLLPDYMVEVFNRMKLHDTIAITSLVGDINTVYNLEVEHEWFDTDKYYAKIDLTFDYDESFVIAGCCNNLI